MKIPKKIYLFASPINGELDYRWLSERADKYDIEYVCKDVFIDKACEFISRRVFNCAEGSILEDFKKYMEN